MKINIIITIILSAFVLPIVSRSQTSDFEVLIEAGVSYSYNKNQVLLDERMRTNGEYESVWFMIIDGDPVLRVENGKVDKNGFVDENAQKAIYFKLSNLRIGWNNPNNQNDGITIFGTAYSPQIGNNLDMELKMTGNSDQLRVGTNVKRLMNFKNLNANRLIRLCKEPNEGTYGMPSSTKSQKSGTPSTKKRTTKPPLKK